MRAATLGLVLLLLCCTALAEPEKPTTSTVPFEVVCMHGLVVAIRIAIPVPGITQFRVPHEACQQAQPLPERPAPKPPKPRAPPERAT
jgi:hypothetical protein